MKRYLLFAGDSFYPAGGWDDFVADFDTAEEAFTHKAVKNDWWQVIDLATGEEVKDGKNAPRI